MAAETNFEVVGKNLRKVDGPGLVCGKPMFTDDIEMRGLLYGKILYSPHAHARIKKIDKTKALALPGVHAVICHEDVPRIAHTTAGQGYPEPSAYDTFVFDKKVRFVGDRVAAVAAETREAAEEAVKLIEVEYEVLPPILDERKSMDPGAPVIHDEPEAEMIIPVPYDKERNLAGGVNMNIGDVEKGLEEADFKFDYEYIVPYYHHCPQEPHICYAWLDDQDRVVIRTSTQVPFHVRRLVARALDIPVKKIHVIKPRVGGGFGCKQEVYLEQVVAALAMASRRPVKIELTRREEFISGRTMHPEIIHLRTGVKKNGDLTAVHLDILMNTGAYGSHALTVVYNSGGKTLPLYRCPNIKFDGTSVYTNLPVGGAYRGYGATEAYFAIETQMDEMAEAIGMDPVEFRKRNHIKEGETSPVFSALGEGKAGVEQFVESCGLDKCIDLGAEAIGWSRRKDLPRTGIKRRGIGMGTFMQGSSIPHVDMGAAYLKLNEDGSFNLLVGATDLGTGSDTVLAQIAAEVLGVPLTSMIVRSSDTDITPFDVGAYASSTTYLSGMAVLRAAEKTAAQIKKVAGKLLAAEPEQVTLKDSRAFVPGGKSVSLHEIAMDSLYVDNQFQIQDGASAISFKSPPPFAAHFAEVEVDTETGKVTLLKYVAACDCGTAINPALAEGQVEGGVVNGIGFALSEEMLFDSGGRTLNPSFHDYKIFTTVDLPEMRTILVPTYEPTGPCGAKSVSEININGPIPVIANAIYDAVGIRLRRSPFTPERVLEALSEKEKMKQ
ncbi:MAG: molybdopterin-dependent oxidoreductase [Chloroflexi bacterium]|nr:molybdopterin-dependent oxidoreductase [Chloroflexota bacterium]